MTGKQAVVVTPCVPKEDAVVLYNELVKIKNNYTPRVCRQEHLSKVPDICVFMMSHVSLTLYSFDFHKYSDVSCCGVKHTLSQFQVLATQRQPTPSLVQKLNWRRWPNGFVVAIFSLVIAIY